MKKFILVIFIIILVVILTITVTVNLTPKPVVGIANALIFGGKPESSTLPDYDQMQESVDILKDETYTSEYPSNTFDVYTPKENVTKSYPTIFWVHGGGFIGGDKSMLENYAVSLASQGFIVIALNYSVAPEYTYPTAVVQTSDFVNFVLENKEKYHINDNELFFAGDSAGAQIVSQYVITQTNTTYSSDMKILQVVPKNAIKGILLFCGPYEPSELANSSNPIFSFIFNQIGWSYFGMRDWSNSAEAQQASIITNVTSDFPPTYITDGNTASFEPMAKSLISRLKELQVKVKERFYNVDEFVTGHEYQFIMGNAPGQTTYQDTVDFLKSCLEGNKVNG